VTSYRFLSDEWIEAMRSLRLEYTKTDAETAAATTLNFTITGVPFGEAERHLHSRYGRTYWEPGHSDTADLSVTMEYSTAQAMYCDRSDDLRVLAQAVQAARSRSTVR
jgi:hypothetical protein